MSGGRGGSGMQEGVRGAGSEADDEIMARRVCSCLGREEDR